MRFISVNQLFFRFDFSEVGNLKALIGGMNPFKIHALLLWVSFLTKFCGEGDFEVPNVTSLL